MTQWLHTALMLPNVCVCVFTGGSVCVEGEGSIPARAAGISAHSRRLRSNEVWAMGLEM